MSSHADEHMVTPAHEARKALWVIAAVALLLRVAFLLLEPAVGPVADERTWTDGARQVASARVGLDAFKTHLLIFHPPLYTYFLAVPFRLWGTFEAVKWIQVVVTALLVLILGRLGFRVFGPRVGLVAAAMAALYPELVWFASHFWVENVFVVLLWWSMERLLTADEEGRWPSAAVAGVLWGLAILARETGLYFIPFAVLWLVFRAPRPGGRARAAAFTLAALLTVAPWTYRNWAVFHAFVPVSTAGGLNLFQGNARLSRQEVYDLYYAVEGKIEQYRYARREGLRVVRERQPTWFFEKLREQMPLFWEAESMAIIHVKRGAYGPVRPWVAVAVACVMLLPYLTILGLFVAGLAVGSYDRVKILLLGFLVYYNLIHVATHGFNRYRLPVMPAVFLFAAVGWVAVRSKSFRVPGWTRRFVALLVALVLALSVAPSIRMHLRHPAFGFAGPALAPVDEAPPP
jgi:4-amino-4-deoxy-L-arabinose transferase-like glycosyltransferase